nr:MAG TPA: hypothetical protein [Bacteriophage sp.]
MEIVSLDHSSSEEIFALLNQLIFPSELKPFSAPFREWVCSEISFDVCNSFEFLVLLCRHKCEEIFLF